MTPKNAIIALIVASEAIYCLFLINRSNVNLTRSRRYSSLVMMYAKNIPADVTIPEPIATTTINTARPRFPRLSSAAGLIPKILVRESVAWTRNYDHRCNRQSVRSNQIQSDLRYVHQEPIGVHISPT